MVDQEADALAQNIRDHDAGGADDEEIAWGLIAALFIPDGWLGKWGPAATINTIGHDHAAEEPSEFLNPFFHSFSLTF